MVNVKTSLRRSKRVDTSAFGRRLRTERQAVGLSLTALAAKVRVTKGYLSRLESGTSRPSVRLAERIANTLGVDAGPLHILAGHFPVEIKEILYRHPIEAPAVLRETFSAYGRDRIAQTARPETSPRTAASSFKAGSTARLSSLYKLVHAECFKWLENRSNNSVHAVVTDPPYGLKEYTEKEKEKLRKGRGGVWRQPPTLNGCKRSPLPRFTVLNEKEKIALRNFFSRWATLIFRILVPGGHVFIASNPLVSHLVYLPMIQSGFEKRGEIIRLVQTLRGGDRPKNAHKEFEGVTVMPRSCWEPWGLFRKPCEGRVQDNLRKWKVGGLRRVSSEQPFSDVIRSAPTRGIERDIAPHPSLKPQAFMRQIVRAALPLGKGIILDPFMGAGSTIAAACALGYKSIGIEADAEFYRMAVRAVPRLARIIPNGNGSKAKDIAREDGQQVLFKEKGETNRLQE